MKIKFSKGFYCFLKWLVAILLYPFFRTKYTNARNIPMDGRYVFAGNHISAFDPILLGIGQKRHIRFMAKAELFKNPISAAFFTLLGAFPVERGRADFSSINNAKSMIDNGEALGIFIEGTRSKTGELLRPKSGAVMIAHQMDCLIVPVSITYRSKKKTIFSRRYVRYGEPISVAELGVVEGGPREYRDASRVLMDKIKELWEADKYGN